MSDLTQRLRAWAHDERLGHGPLLLDAAAEIERLRDIISPGDAAAYEEGMAALLARCEAAEARLAKAERDEDQLIKERDYAEKMADKLADAIAALTGVDIGEHSSGNCPWHEALEAADEAIAASSAPDAPGGGRGCDENW